MRLVFASPKLLDLNLGLFCTFSLPVSIWNVLLETRISVITVLSEVFLHGTPEELNEIKFLVKLGKEDPDVTCSFPEP